MYGKLLARNSNTCHPYASDFFTEKKNQCHLMGQMHNVNSKSNLKKTDLFSNKWN